jgi:thiamine-monophosphate kinase
MAANLSDVAAMGGVPRYALVTLCMPEERSVEDVDAFYDGLMRLATRFDVRIIGGDISGMPGPATVSITVLGETPEARMVRRSGAQAGDLICVTGDLGASEAGLRLLQAARQRKKTAWMDLFEKTITKHRLPLPRVREAQLLAASGAVHAMIDISDGLSADALHMGEDSGVGLSLDARRWPIDAQTRAAARKLHLNPVELALNSGEEFELLCAVAPDAAPDLCRRTMDATGTPLTIIGEARTEAYGFSWQDETGTHPLISGGYDHFSGS